MVTEQITIRESRGMSSASAEVYAAEAVTDDTRTITEVRINTRWTKQYLTAEDDPVLAKLWDNDDDAIFDTM